MRKYFGTDGVRGVANSELTPHLAFALARAAGHILSKKIKKDGKLLAVIGADTRISGDMLKSSLIAGFNSSGMDVIDLGVITTPAVAHLTIKYGADVGVMVSASHNPMEYNGIKFFNSKGYKLDDNIELEIENHLESDFGEIKTHEHLGVIEHNKNGLEDYIDYLGKAVPLDLKGIKIAMDCANGASFEVAPKIFERLGAEVVAINNEPNGININDKCGSTHPESLQKKVVEIGADYGLAYDGDADRLIAVDEKGEIVDGDKIMLLVANHIKKDNNLKNNTLVVTVMSNLGLFAAAKKLGIDLEKTKVGDRYVLENMQQNGHIIGGEQSGHIILLDLATTGDGVLSSLMLSKVIKESGKKLSELATIMDIFPQVLLNVKVEDKYKNTYMEIPEVKEVIEKVENILGDDGRILIRPSGTEPLIRVMLEGKNQDEIQKLAEEIVDIIEEKCK